MNRIEDLLAPIRRLHEEIRMAVVAACETASLEAMAGVVHEGGGDTIYAIDRVSEELLVDFFAREVAVYVPIVLIGEGLAEGQIVLPEGAMEAEAKWRIIVDPIDGTRGIMYQKRSAWILTGVAPNKGAATMLSDIELAVQTEIPLVKQHLSDVLWVLRGAGVEAVRHNRLTGEERPLTLQPSRATTIAHGFAMISRFIPGARDILAAIDEEVVQAVLGPVQQGKALCFEDQYICSGGQLYELMAGHDRFVADLRPLMEQVLAKEGVALGLCCHPYDLCTVLIAQELGVIVADEQGRPLDAPLDLESDIAWVGYANEAIRAQIEPVLLRVLGKRGFYEGFE